MGCFVRVQTALYPRRRTGPGTGPPPEKSKSVQNPVGWLGWCFYFTPFRAYSSGYSILHSVSTSNASMGGADGCIVIARDGLVVESIDSESVFETAVCPNVQALEASMKSIPNNLTLGI